MSIAIDVLNRGHYNIKYYTETDSNRASLKISWKDETINFEWKDGVFRCPEFKFELECPLYLAPIITHSMVVQICEHNNFPMDYLQFYCDNKPVPEFIMGTKLEDEDELRFEILHDIYIDMLVSGITPETIEIVKEHNIQKPFSILFKLFFDCSINFD